MRILFVSNDLIAGHLAFLLLQEGHDVRLYIEEEGRRGNFNNLVPKTDDWKADLRWVGKDGLIIFDDVGYGAMQDSLRDDGYTVFGGSAGGDLLEKDRSHGQEMFERVGMRSPETKDFTSIDEAIAFARTHPGPWVIKQNGVASKGLNYVGVFQDSRDVLDVLAAYKKNNAEESHALTLQKKVDGVEIAVTRYFNGTDWVGPMLINVEHKKFFPGDIGPTTSEMGTLGWYDSDENNKLFQETLAKLKPYLQKTNYRGIFDINCIVNEDGAFPIEATSRAGSPIIHLQTELTITPWFELVLAIARGQDCHVRYRKGVGIVVMIATPPFPYAKKIEGHSLVGSRVYFLDSMTEEEKTHIHFEEVAVRGPDGEYHISDDRGLVLYVTGTGTRIEEAQQKTYSIIKKIHIPKMLYRNDIGTRFEHEDYPRLKKLGYVI